MRLQVVKPCLLLEVQFSHTLGLICSFSISFAGQKQTIEELSKQNESTLGALVQKCTEVNRHKDEVAQLIKEKEELQAHVSRVNDIAKLLSSTCAS